jgi:hypothetical protein
MHVIHVWLYLWSLIAFWELAKRISGGLFSHFHQNTVNLIEYRCGQCVFEITSEISKNASEETKQYVQMKLANIMVDHLDDHKKLD